MEEGNKGGGEQIYDEIDDSDEENSKSGKAFSAWMAAAVRGKKGTVGRAANGTVESAKEKRNILYKLREKFRLKSSEELTDSFEFREDNETSSIGATVDILEDEVAARRRAFEHMRQRAKSFPSSSMASASLDDTDGANVGVSKPSRLRMLSFGVLGRAKDTKNGDILMPHHYEQAGDSCVHLQNSFLCDQPESPFAQESDPPAIPDRPPPGPPPLPVKQQQRPRAKSLTFPLDRESFAGKEINFNKYKKTDPSASEQASDLPSLKESVEKLSNYGWYWGPLNRYEADEKLRGKPDGSFLVRDSFHEFHLYSVSFRAKGLTLHTRIKYDNGWFGFLTPKGLEPKSNSVVTLIKRSIRISQRGTLCFTHGSITWPSYPIRFLLPVSRFEDLPSLQHLCRFIIRQNSRSDKLQELPLPPKLIRYLSVDNHFLPESELDR